MKRVFLAALALTATALVAFAGSATADSQGPINFESYNLGNINGQNGWSNTGGYDANVASSRFGGKALQISDAVTSGSFGDQTFSPGLATPASESGPRVFDANFSIGSTSDAQQPGLHLSVSPDSGDGSRMSYLRFADQSDGIHVYFDDAKDSGLAGTAASFSDTDIATLNRSSAHTVRIWMDLVPGPANDVVKVYIDGTLRATGTSWEDYYRYDPEQTGNVPSVDKLLFREGGDANSADKGNGFLIDNVSLASGTDCKTIVGSNLTAAQIGGNVTASTPLATGCDIGVYYGAGDTGNVSGADISGAKQYGVYVNSGSHSVTDSKIHQIGDSPFSGNQYGRAVYYTSGATGTVSGNQIYDYQKNGVVLTGDKTAVNVLNNTVTGRGHLSTITQNGVVILDKATGLIKGNSISHNWYTGTTWTAYGLLIMDANGVRQQANSFLDNQANLGNFGRGGGSTSA